MDPKLHSAHKAFQDAGFVTFGLDISAYINKDNVVKKKVMPKSGFPKFTLTSKKRLVPADNSLGLLCGTANGIIVIDIDNLSHLSDFLKVHNKTEKDLEQFNSQTTASGGLHLIFEYSDDLSVVSGRDHCLGTEYAIDVRTTGNFIYVAPTEWRGSAVDANGGQLTEVQFKYEWNPGHSLFDHAPLPMPSWLKTLLIEYALRNKAGNSKEQISKDKNKEKLKEKSLARSSNEESKMKTIKVDSAIAVDIIKFIADNYGHRVAKSQIKEHICGNDVLDHTREFQVPLPTKMCPFKGSEHSSNHQYVLINSTGAKQKCHDNESPCVDQDGRKKVYHPIAFADMPQNIQEHVGMHEIKRDVALQQMAASPFQDHLQPDIAKMDFSGVQMPVMSPSGTYTVKLPNSRYCPICKKYHDVPQNSIILDAQGRRYCSCALQPNAWFPNPTLEMPQQHTQLIFGNNVTINQGASSNTELETFLPSDYAKDRLLIHNDNSELQIQFFGCLNGDHNGIASYFYELHKEEFRCFGRNREWYQYKDNVWRPISTDKIRFLLSGTEFKKPLGQAILFYRQNPQVELALAKQKKIQSLYDQLGSDTFKGNVVHECETVFFSKHEDFEESLNAANLVPFANGVLDLSSLEFREGLPHDNMSLSTGISFRDYDPNNEIVQQIEQWFEEVQPDDEQRHYLKKLCGYFLTNETDLQHVWIWTGAGQNAKSFFIDKILKPAFGDFFCSGSTQLLTRKRENANETNEALMNILKRRVVVFTEPEANETIQAATLKQLSGGDELTARGLHQKQQSVVPTFKSVLVCNDIPKVSEDSYAVWRRIRVVNWPVTFKDAPDPSNRFERKLDRKLGDKIKDWPPYFAGCVVHWLKQYRDEGLDEPRSVVKHTEQYKEDNDPYAKFISEEIEVGTEEPGMKQSELNNLAKVWFREERIPFSKAILRQHLSNRHGVELQLNYPINGSPGFADISKKK